MIHDLGISTATKGNVRVHVEFADEGNSGDYDPSNPGDVPHLRFWVYVSSKSGIEGLDKEMSPDDDGFYYVPTTSYCTEVTLGREPDDVQDARVMDALATFICDRMSDTDTERELREIAKDLSQVTNSDLSL